MVNSYFERIEYVKEMNNLNKSPHESLVWKTKHEKIKCYHNVVMEKKSRENDTFGSSCIARLSELKQQILILESGKCEVEDKLSSCMDSLILNLKLKGNDQDTDNVRATYLELAMMGVGINNITEVVYIVLKNFECLPNESFARLLYKISSRLSQHQVAENLLKD